MRAPGGGEGEPEGEGVALHGDPLQHLPAHPQPQLSVGALFSLLSLYVFGEPADHFW